MTHNNYIENIWIDYHAEFNDDEIVNDLLLSPGINLKILDEKTGELIDCGYLHDHLNHFEQFDEDDYLF